MVVLHGGSTAGGAYMPGMSDYVIGVKENGMAALGGAALVKAATGEVANDRELGGTEMHASVSGCVEYLVEDDAHGLLKAREVFERLDWNRRATPIPRRAYQPPNILRSNWLARCQPIPKCPTTVARCLRALWTALKSRNSAALWRVHVVCPRQHYRYCLCSDW